jgi:hypothetical protein
MSNEENPFIKDLEERKARRARAEQTFSQILAEQQLVERKLAKTAEEAAATLNSDHAESALIINFIVGGVGPQTVGALQLLTGMRLGTTELWLGGTLLAIRTAEIPLAPVILINNNPYETQAVKDVVERIRFQAMLFIKGIVSVGDDQLYAYRIN